MKNQYKLVLIAAASMGLTAPGAIAQDAPTAPKDSNYYSRDKFEAVKNRWQPEFDPESVRIGTFLVDPRLELSATSDSNVFASETDEASDVVAYIAASVIARTDWNNHEMRVEVSGNQNEYFDLGNESNFEFRSRVSGRLDVSRSVSLRGTAFFEDKTEARTEIANRITNQRPIEFQSVGGKAGIEFRNGRLRLAADVDLTKFDYEDGLDANNNDIDQDFRNRTRTGAAVRASYAINPNVAVFGQGRVTNREYDNLTIVNGTGFNRDSEGYDVQAGLDFELSALFRGVIGVGYLEEDRQDERFEDIDGVSVDANLQWAPTQLTTVTFNGSQGSEDQGLLEAPSALSTRYGARIDHELRRNVIVSAEASIENYKFDDIDREDDVTSFGIGADWKLNRSIHLQAFARQADRDTSGASRFFGQSFDKTVIGLGFRLFP